MKIELGVLLLFSSIITCIDPYMGHDMFRCSIQKVLDIQWILIQNLGIVPGLHDPQLKSYFLFSSVNSCHSGAGGPPRFFKCPNDIRGGSSVPNCF